MQHDYNIANSDGATVRSDINSALQALAECSSGATAPSTTFAYQWWADTANDLLKQRNAANSGWISVLTLSTGAVTSGGIADIVDDTSPTLGGALDCDDLEVGKAKLKDYGETLTTANTSTAYTVDLTSGNVFELTLTGNCVYTFSNPPATGIGGSFTLIQKQDGTGSRTVTWPASVEWAGGTAPTITSTASSVDIFTFITTDAGTTWYGFTAGQDFS